MRERLTAAAALAVLLLLAGAGAAAPAPDVGDTTGEFATAPLVQKPVARDLRGLLALVDGNLPLRVTLASRDQAVGHPWRVYGDTLLLVAPTAWEAGQAPRRVDLRGVPLDDITRVEQSRSGARAGAGWGAKSGALVVGGLGLLVGVAVAAISDGDSDVVPVLAFGAVGAGAGALAGGGLGAGIGALGRDWVTLWPLDAAGEALPQDAAAGDATRRARLVVEGAWSFDDGAELDGRGPGARLGIVRRIGDIFELGPFAEYHDLRGLYRYESIYDPYPPATGSLAARNRQFILGLDLRAHGRGEGVRPFGTAGIGWCLGGDFHVGAHGGGGLRWRGRSGHEVSLVVRRYFEVTGARPRQSRFWSVAAGVTFGR